MGNNKYNLSETRKAISKLEPTINYTSLERQKLRLEIARNMVNQGSYNSKTKEFNNSVEYKKRIDFVIGIAGGGKSSVLANPLSEENKAIVLDSDWAKEQLPEYNDGLGATRVHLESKLVFMLALENALRNNMNIVISIVGKTLQTIIDIHKLAKDNGYEQHLHLNEVPPNVACDRGMKMGRITRRIGESIEFVDGKGYANLSNEESMKLLFIELAKCEDKLEKDSVIPAYFKVEDFLYRNGKDKSLEVKAAMLWGALSVVRNYGSLDDERMKKLFGEFMSKQMKLV